ncbi:MAG: hypothetical protein OEU40_15225, partial [Gammaproteobacteria bacterium]|nr:hypothetical protein [Gammaproteobacteria bacterium]
MRFVATVFFLCLGSVAYSQESTWPGGIAFIELGAVEGTAPVVEYNGKRVLVMNDNGRWRVAVGVPLDTTVGEASIMLADGSRLTFDVQEHAYPEQRLEVSKSYVSLSEENL